MHFWFQNSIWKNLLAFCLYTKAEPTWLHLQWHAYRFWAAIWSPSQERERWWFQHNSHVSLQPGTICLLRLHKCDRHCWPCRSNYSSMIYRCRKCKQKKKCLISGVGEPHLQGNSLMCISWESFLKEKVDRNILLFYGVTVQLCEKTDHVMTAWQELLLFRSTVHWDLEADKSCWRNLTYITLV